MTLSSVRAGNYRVRGLSTGGIQTSLHVPELDALFDVGIAARSTAGVNNIFISHGHADHIGALVTFLGMRGLMGKKRAPRVFLPREMRDDLVAALSIMSKLHRFSLEIDAVAMDPGQTVEVRADLVVEPFRTYHPVPSLGYKLLRTSKKLRREYSHLSGPEIARLRRAGGDIFYQKQTIELAYATDTLAKVLDDNPTLYDARVLILECTFLDEQKSLRASQAGCHIHLDELIQRADEFRNESLVLMHFSQIYKPRDVESILKQRCPPHLWERIVPFVPRDNTWFG